MFASNIQRLMLLGDIAQRTGRKICLLGRSLNTQVEVATRIGRLNWPSNLLLSADQARQWPREQLIVLAGGSQAERNSAMRRLASGHYPFMEIEPDDCVVMSSRIIPGNERVVYEMMGDLLRRGIRLHTRVTSPDVHTSGHAGRSEQVRMLEMIRPRSFLPVHGTLHHLLRHAEVARGCGVGDVLVAENGTAVRYDGQKLSKDGEVQHGKIPIALGGEPLSQDTLRRRGELGRQGLVTLSVVVDANFELIIPPQLSTRGVPMLDDEPELLAGVAREVTRQLERVRNWRGVDLEEELRRAARRKVCDICGCKPVIALHLIQVGAQ
jgi:ribonuclease J